MIEKLFNHLDKWRGLPGYQLERRADIFFAIHIPVIWKECYGEEVKRSNSNQEIIGIIPEFPIRKGLLPIHDKHNPVAPKKPNQSFKIDYMVVSESHVSLVELKTAESSRNKKQDWYLEEAAQQGIQKLAEGVIEIHNNTTKQYRRKYEHLLEQLVLNGILRKTGDEYIANEVKASLRIVYIQPENPDEADGVLSFEQIAKVISKIEDPITNRFRVSLENNWQKKV